MKLIDQLGTLDSAIAALGALQLEARNVGSHQSVKVRNAQTARAAAQSLLTIAGVRDLAKIVLSSQILADAVQDSFTFDDDQQASQCQGLDSARRSLLNAASILRTFIAGYLHHPGVDIGSNAMFSVLTDDNVEIAGWIARLNELNDVLELSIRLAKEGGLTERLEPVVLAAVESGSVIFDCVGNPGLLLSFYGCGRKPWTFSARPSEIGRKLSSTE